jgi:hypothetical protein
MSEGLNASVSGGTSNSAQGDLALSRVALTMWRAFCRISGGSGNEAKGNYTSVSGGKQRDALEQDSWRGGSLLERN